MGFMPASDSLAPQRTCFELRFSRRIRCAQLMARGEVKDSDSEHESDGDEDHPKPYEQEMRDLKNEVLEGIKKEEYPLPLRE